MAGSGRPSRDDAVLAGAQLRAVREAAGMSLDQLAAKVPFKKSTLGNYETGTRRPSDDVQLWYERACDASLGPVSAMRVLGRADVDRRGFLLSAVYSAALSATGLMTLPKLARLIELGAGRRVGMAEVDAIRAVTMAFLRLDEVRGGGAGRSPVAEFLATEVNNVLTSRFTDDRTRSAAFSAAAELAHLAGFKAHDAGQDAISQRYYLVALRLAEESKTPGQDAFILRALALQGVDIRQRRFSTDLADAALRRAHGHFGPATTALFQIGLARCYAETGNHGEAAAALRTAAPAITTVDDEPAPSWIQMWVPNSATAVDQTAKTFAALGDHTEAEVYFRLGATIWDARTHSRVHALAQSDAALARWRIGDHGGAVDQWASVVPALQDINSARTANALSAIRSHAPALVTVV